MVTMVKSTYSGSNHQYAVSGVRVSSGPSKDGDNEIRLQLAGTTLEFDIPVGFDDAERIQQAINEAKGKGSYEVATFDITDVTIEDLVAELNNRLN